MQFCYEQNIESYYCEIATTACDLESVYRVTKFEKIHLIKNIWLHIQGHIGIITRSEIVHVELPCPCRQFRRHKALRYAATQILLATYG